MTLLCSGNDIFAPGHNFHTDLYWVPGGELFAYENRHGKIVAQELNCTSCQAFQIICQMDGKSKYLVQDNGPLLLTFIALQEDYVLSMDGLGTVHIREGQYNMIYSPVFNLEITQETSKEYICLCLNYKLAALQEMAPHFPQLVGFLENIHAGQPTILHYQAPWITDEIREAIYNVLHCSVNISLFPVYINILTKSLLFHLFWQCAQRQPSRPYSHQEIESIYAARDIIRKNLRYHYIIPEIAQKVGMNEFKLKNGFRDIFGNGVYEYLHAERMNEARQLLSEPGRTIKEVANLSGYKSVTSFIKAFKKKFHQTPGEFKKIAYL